MMEEKSVEALTRELASAKHLLAARAKQIAALKNDVAGHEELARLLSGFLSLLALATGGDAAALEAVRVEGEREAIAVVIDKEGIAKALTTWQLQVECGEEAYRLMFVRPAKEAEDACRGKEDNT